MKTNGVCRYFSTSGEMLSPADFFCWTITLNWEIRELICCWRAEIAAALLADACGELVEPGGAVGVADGEAVATGAADGVGVVEGVGVGVGV